MTDARPKNIKTDQLNSEKRISSNRLSQSEIKNLMENIVGWKYNPGLKNIEKLYTFPSFIEAVLFVNEVARISEKLNHHPDILLKFNKVILTFTTHSSDGLTSLDINAASKIDSDLC